MVRPFPDGNELKRLKIDSSRTLFTGIISWLLVSPGGTQGRIQVPLTRKHKCQGETGNSISQ